MVTGGGFSLLSEAVYLGKPMLSVPLHGQFEQLMNARYLEREGYGICAADRRRGRRWRRSSTARRIPASAGGLRAGRQREALDDDRGAVTAAGADARRERARARRRRGGGGGVNARDVAGAPRRAAPRPASRSTPGQYPTAQIYGPTIDRVRGAGERLALTYDDGPNPRETPRLLELLARYDAKATFFLIGELGGARAGARSARSSPRGHAIGNHTYTHPTMPLPARGRIREELRACREAVEASGETLLARSTAPR